MNTVKDDGTHINFSSLKVQAPLSANTVQADTKPVARMIPAIVSQLGADNVRNLRMLAEQVPQVLHSKGAPRKLLLSQLQQK